MLKSKLFKRSLVVLAICALVPVGAMAQKKDPVMVGLVSSKSGTFAQQGEEVIRAVEFAIDEANAKGGVDGHKVELITRSREARTRGIQPTDRGDPFLSVAGACTESGSLGCSLLHRCQQVRQADR